jgi:hypothetical protein
MQRNRSRGETAFGRPADANTLTGTGYSVITAASRMR